MKISVLKEKKQNENRVSVSAETVKKYCDMGFEVFIEQNAGVLSNISDEAYQKAGAKVTSNISDILCNANILLKVQIDTVNTKEELNFLPRNAIIIGLLSVLENQTTIEQYAKNYYSSFALELMPRISRAQNMDVLSSQSNLTGYKAVIEAANQSDYIFPMMMTAAGTITPAKVLVLGTGVAGLQAIATAKRLGAVVSAFDVRKSAKEQVESLGAKFIEVDCAESAESTSGYALETSEQYKLKQEELIATALPKHDIIICTAMIPGKKAPILINEKMLHTMKKGAVIVDLAIMSGGNCELSKKDDLIVYNDVKIIAFSNMASRVSANASQLYAKNLFNFVELIFNKNQKVLTINQDDDIIKSTLVTHQGEIVNHIVKEVYQNG